MRRVQCHHHSIKTLLERRHRGGAEGQAQHAVRQTWTGMIPSHGYRSSYFASKASIATWAMASSTSEGAPLTPMPPSTWPSTRMGSPP